MALEAPLGAEHHLEGSLGGCSSEIKLEYLKIEKKKILEQTLCNIQQVFRYYLTAVVRKILYEGVEIWRFLQQGRVVAGTSTSAHKQMCLFCSSFCTCISLE